MRTTIKSSAASFTSDFKFLIKKKNPNQAFSKKAEIIDIYL